VGLGERLGERRAIAERARAPARLGCGCLVHYILLYSAVQHQTHIPTHTHTHSNMSSIRPPAEIRALLLSLREDAARLSARLVVSQEWLNVADLRLVSLETCLARRRRGQRGHAARRGATP
jgi:hypothetical protein